MFTFGHTLEVSKAIKFGLHENNLDHLTKLVNKNIDDKVIFNELFIYLSHRG